MASTGEVWKLGHRPALDGVRNIAILLVPFGLPLALAFAFLVRGAQRLADAQLFAEDGTVFFADSHNLGVSALWEPYAGYLHVIPRLIAAVVGPAPMTGIPALYAAVAAAFYLVMVAPILSARIGWLIPSRLGRVGGFAALCLLPPMDEAYGNISNLIFVGGIALLLLVASDDPVTARGRWAELVAVGLLVVSGPIGALLSPAFVLRWWRNGMSWHSTRVGLVVAAGAAIQTLVFLGSVREDPGGGSFAIFVRAIIERVAGEWLLGDRGVSGASWVFAAAWLAVALLVTVVALGLPGLAGWAVVAALVGASVTAYGSSFLGAPNNYERHLVIPLAVLAVMLVATTARASGLQRMLAAACLVAGVGGVVDELSVPAYPSDSNMTRLEACVDTGRTPCVIPIYAPGWTVTLGSGRGSSPTR